MNNRIVESHSSMNATLRYTNTGSFKRLIIVLLGRAKSTKCTPNRLYVLRHLPQLCSAINSSKKARLVLKVTKQYEDVN